MSYYNPPPPIKYICTLDGTIIKKEEIEGGGGRRHPMTFFANF